MDVISRKEVLETLNFSMEYWKMKDSKVHDVVKVIYNSISEIPAASGEGSQDATWQSVYSDDEIKRGFNPIHICSNCGLATSHLYLYCPECGSYMGTK